MIEQARHIARRNEKRLRDLAKLPRRVARLEQLIANTLAGRVEKHGEWGVYSQNGEDGIVSAVASVVDDDNHFFVEIGVGNYEECNTKVLCVAHGWRGAAFDLPEVVANTDIDRFFRAHYPLKLVGEFITAASIVDSLERVVPDGQRIGFLSLDIDGQDYFVLEALLSGIDQVPEAIMVEYNSHFGADEAVTVPRDPEFHRFKLSSTGLVFGASLGAFEQLLGRFGYELAYVEHTGMNALFVQGHLIAKLPDEWRRHARFRPSNSRQARDEDGRILIDETAEGIAARVADCVVWELSASGHSERRLSDIATDFTAYW